MPVKVELIHHCIESSLVDQYHALPVIHGLEERAAQTCGSASTKSSGRGVWAYCLARFLLPEPVQPRGGGAIMLR